MKSMKEKHMSKQHLLNVTVDCLTMDQVLEHIEELITAKRPAYVVPVNTDVIVQIERDQQLKDIVDHANLVLVDGQPLIWLSKLFRRPVVEKISGSDLVPLLFERTLQKKQSIFILGGKSQVLQKARENLENRYPGIQIVGTYSPPLGFENDTEELKRIDDCISRARPDILIVCLGCPKQEKWVYEHYMQCSATVTICAGATVDFIAGSVKRAPKWMSDCGLEWLYRTIQEPRRLARRYWNDFVYMIPMILKYRKNSAR